MGTCPPFWLGLPDLLGRDAVPRIGQDSILRFGQVTTRQNPKPPSVEADPWPGATPKARRGFGPQKGGQNGVAPGHGVVFAASLSGCGARLNSPRHCCLAVTVGGIRCGTICGTCSVTDGSTFRPGTVL